MKFLSHLPGSFVAPWLRQGLRPRDGVRGLFLTRGVPRGALLMSVPLHACYFPQGIDEMPPGCVTDDVWQTHPRHLRRCNRHSALFPEVWSWLQRYSPDATSERVLLSASMSCGEAADDASSPLPSVVTVHVSPVEAALTTSISLRYFFTHIAPLTLAVRQRLHVCGPSDALSDAYMHSLPTEVFLTRGVESLYGGAVGPSSYEHGCLEQIAWNIRDAVMMHAHHDAYRLLEQFPSELDELLLVVLYMVRSRVLRIPLLRGSNSDYPVHVFAPGVDGINHCSHHPSVAAAISPAQRAVVVRAQRDIRRGEELTMSYANTDKRELGLRGDESHTLESRYLFSEA